MGSDALTAAVLGDLALVLLLSWSVGGLVSQYLGQPQVIGQILTGMLLGPSVLGRLPGDPQSRLFPVHALPTLNALAQVGVVTFMFMVGYELDLRSVRGHGRAVSLVASSALLVPLMLGASGVLLFPSLFHGVGEHHVGRAPFVLFVAVATSVTALPVLAAIVRERGLAGTRAGTVATSAAGMMDVAAWLVLLAAVAGAHQTSRPLVVTCLLVAALIAVMLLVVRPVLDRWLRRSNAPVPGRWPRRSDAPAFSLVPLAVVLAVGTAWMTTWLGVHAVFGALLAGLAMPRRDGAQDADVVRTMEGTGKVLLPLFFVITGLSLNVEALHAGDLWLLGLLLLVACAGKLLPSYLGARLGGIPAGESATVAALLNTRGLTELIVLSVGLSSGLIHQRLYALFILMALITTVMTNPLLSLIGTSGETDLPEPPPGVGITGDRPAGPETVGR